jgi:hypothetical protein
MSTIRGATVIRAIHDLRRQEGARSIWPTANQIAAYLRAPTEDVAACLEELKAERIFTDRRRKGERVWMPWSET